MEKQRQVLYFIISDTESLADHLLENVILMLHNVLDQFNIVKSDHCSDLLLTLNSFLDQRECIIENKIMECFELCGHIVCVTQFEFDKAIIMRFENEKKIEELIIELQTKEIFVDSNGSALNVKTLTENKKMSMIIAIFFSKIDDISLSDFILIENLSEVFQIRRPEIIEIFFGKKGVIEESVKQTWIHPKHTQNNQNKNITKEIMLSEEMSRNPLTPKNVKNCKMTKNYKNRTIYRNLSSEKSRNILIYGAFSSEKCKLLENICKKFSQSDCKMMVNHELKEVNIVGRNFGSFQKYVKMIETQLTMFHWNEINFSKKLFNHLTKNSNIVIRFEKVLLQNKFDSVILVENSLGRPAAFGINKTITDNFIKWLEKEFIKESFKLPCPIEIHESNGMKYSLSLLELNHLVSIEVVNDEVMIQGLSVDVSSVIPDVKRIISKHTSILGQPMAIQNPQQNYYSIYFAPPSDSLLAPAVWINKNQEMIHFQKGRSKPHPKCTASSSLLSPSVSKPTSSTTHIPNSEATSATTSAISPKPSNIIPSTPSTIELPMESKVLSSVIKISSQCSESSSSTTHIGTPITMPLVAFTLNKSHSNHKIYDKFVTFTDPSSSSSSTSKENNPLRLPVTTHSNPSNSITTFADISSSSLQLSASLLPPSQSLSSTIKTSTNEIHEMPLASSYFYQMDDNIPEKTTSQSIVLLSACLVNNAKLSSRNEYFLDSSTNINNTITDQASIKLTSEHTLITSQSLTTMHQQSLISTDATKTSRDRNEGSMWSAEIFPTKTPACKQFIETPTQHVITSTTSSHLKLILSTQSIPSHTASTTAKTMVNKSSEIVQVSESNLVCECSSSCIINDLASFEKSFSSSISPIITTPSTRTMQSSLESNQTSSSALLTIPSKRNTNPSQSIVSPTICLINTAESSSIQKYHLDSSSNINNTTTRQASIKLLTSESHPLAASKSLMKEITMDQQPLISTSQDGNEISMFSSRSIPTETPSWKQSIETQPIPNQSASTAESLMNESSKIILKVSKSNVICNRSSRFSINDLAAVEKSFSSSINMSPITSTPTTRTMHSSLRSDQTSTRLTIPNPQPLTTGSPVDKNALPIHWHASSSSQTTSKNTYADFTYSSTLGLPFISPMEFDSSVELQEFIDPSKLSQQECYRNSRSEGRCSIL